MAKLTRESFDELWHRVCVYGPPKSGKSWLVAQLAEAGFTVDWFDLENGFQVLQKLSDEALERINYYNIPDSPTNPVAIKTIGRIFTSREPVRMCEAHGVVTCPVCKSGIVAFDYNNMRDPNRVVVIDSVTQLTASATALAGKRLINSIYQESADHKMEWDDWGYVGMLLTQIFGAMQQAKFNVVVISHEDMVDKTDGRKEINPVAGTRNYSASFGKYFDHVLYCFRENNSHKVASSTTFRANVLTGSRTDADISKMTLADILRGKSTAKKPASPAATQTTTGSSALKAAAGISASLRKLGPQTTAATTQQTPTGYTADKQESEKS